jgi:Terminase large subunit, T4likevirus-type, N-terminal
MLSSALADFEEFIAGLTPDEFRRVEEATRRHLETAWLPDPRNEPQLAAYYSDADLLLYGGAAGGGKTSLIVGLACSQHRRSVIFRAKAVDLRGVQEELFKVLGTRDGWNGQDNIMRQGKRVIELGHLEKPGSERSWQGRPHDLICFDEAAQLGREKVQFVLAWLRTDDFAQRCRCVMASNPPTSGDGDWLLEWFAPWLDEKFGNRAEPGELRYAATAPDREGTTVWLPDGRPIIFTEGRNWRYATQEEIASDAKDVIQPLTRTFIPSRLDDNPHIDKKYRAQLQTLGEPLRSQLLHGSFLAGRQDHEWQVIPTAWVKAAQARWTENPPRGAVMSAIGVDVAQGGDDNTVLACRHAHWYAPLVVERGIETPRPSDVAGLVVKHRRNGAAVVVDVGGGYGGGVKERLEENAIPVRAFDAAAASGRMTADRQLYFANRRAEAHWRFREALDPDQLGGSIIELPPDPQLFADLTAVRWKLTSRGIQIESKEDLKKPERLGRSPDRGDAVIMAWSEGERAIISALRKKSRAPFPALPKVESINLPVERGTGWMAK